VRAKKPVLVIFMVFLLVTFFALTAAAEEVEEKLWQARSVFYTGEYEEAELLWLELKEEDHIWEANFFLGMTYLRKDSPEEALDHMEVAFNHKPDNYYTLVNYARILHRNNKLESARDILLLVPEDMRKYNEQYYSMRGLLAMAERKLRKSFWSGTRIIRK